MAMRENAGVKPAGESPTQTATTAHACGLSVLEVQEHGTTRAAEQQPVHTVRGGGGHHGVVVAHFDPGWSRRAHELPAGSVTTKDHHSLVMPYDSTGNARISVETAAPTLTSRDRLALVVPHVTDSVARVAGLEPTHTLTAKGKQAVLWADEDIDRCPFRMFELDEIAGAMVMARHIDGSPYIVLGNKAERMAQYGNSVTPPAMAFLIRRLAEAGYPIGKLIDLFCGAGGSALGAELAGAILALGLNHWPRAIETHSTNFQHADHDCADISALTTHQIKKYVRHAQADGLIGGAECTNHANSKGSKRIKPITASLFDDGPAGDEAQEKSRATMWDMVRFTEQAFYAGKPFKFVICENVVEAYNWGPGDQGGLFRAWLQAMENMGYRYEIVWLNSMFAPPAPDPAPQSRDRMYTVFTLKTLPAPNFRLEPPCWCPHCERVVAGRQTFKRQDMASWGRYWFQYIYGCPSCARQVIPGAFTASTIIDRSKPILPVGEHKPKKCNQCETVHPVACSTRGRMRRGLTKLDGEPFAIRWKKNGKLEGPTTLPLIVRDPEHDGQMMVMPTNGNTYERQPGNRARDAHRRPLPAVDCSTERAIVVPPSGEVAGRPAGRAPAPTQVATTRAGVLDPDGSL